MNPHSLIAVLGLIIAWSVSAPLLAQTGTPASASGWSRGGGMAYASAYDACAEQVDRLRLAYRAEVVFTGDLKRAKAGNASFCEFEVTRGSRVTRVLGEPVYDLSISQVRR